MKKKILFITLLLLMQNVLFAQDSTLQNPIKISLITCGAGDEVYSTFGHSAIRVNDGVRDVVYNWGTFNGFEEGFIMKFMRGKLLYYVSMEDYLSFVHSYENDDRRVEEQILILSENQKPKFLELLKFNIQPENKYYKYDFVYDNCATRIRDLFPTVYESGFEFGNNDVGNHSVTFRDIINFNFRNRTWERLGVNVLFGCGMDKKMTTEEAMFLPQYLQQSLANAKVDGVSVAEASRVVVQGRLIENHSLNLTLICITAISFLSILTFFIKKTKTLRRVLTFIILFITGLLGVLMLLMWFGTDHQACANNFNLLWALPTHLYVAFASKKNKSRYGIISILFLMTALVLHLTGVQQLLFPELLPWLLALFFIHISFILNKN